MNIELPARNGIAPKLRFRDKQIEMAHGAGGIASHRLIEGLIAPYFANAIVNAMGDSAALEVGSERLAITADGFVVKPLRFPGGSIGELAVNGTVNDLAVSGAKPVALLTTMILEAGLPSDVLEYEIAAMARAARRADVAIVGGDTKVVEHGAADGMYITTFGLGVRDPRSHLSPERVTTGDKLLLSGPIGDHGITILLARGELDLEADLSSDTQPLWETVEALLEACGEALHWMRDPTRGGVATVLNELARARQCGIMLSEDRVPVRDTVRGACEILGLDPLHIANEGRLIAVVAPERADAALAALRRVSRSGEPAIFGEIVADRIGSVVGVTGYGGTRAIDMLVGDPLPRIC
ncbi:MAG: hydrogenase expression/formation protein HypE [Candidatus Velthaea sp.]